MTGLTELPSFLARSFSEVLIAIEEQGATPAGEPSAYYPTVPNGVVEVEVGFPVADRFVAAGDVVPAQLPGGQVVTGVHVGACAGVATAYARPRAWAIANGLRPTNDTWEVYLTDPEGEPNPERWRTAFFLKVE